MRKSLAHPLFYALSVVLTPLVVLSGPVVLSAVEGPATLALLCSKKEEWKTAHANKNAFAAFSIPLFCTQALASRADLCHGERQPNHLPFCSAHFYISSSGSREV